MTETRENAITDELTLLGAGQSFEEEMCHMLEGAWMFQDFDWPEILALAKVVQAYAAAPGTVIFREGAQGSYLCLVVSGRIAISKEDGHGASKEVAAMGAGKMVGEMALIDGEPRSATCTALDAATVVLLTKDNFQRMTQQYPALGLKVVMKIARLLSQRLRRTSGMLVDYLQD
ncbi:MAG TPA: cyclic nucleotide-binding domain-containing protein [Betaproteobacteria bacterium]|nr:cyclic nucleotide-binding domain-containing protein [Betaproteobacteria bacterium]